MNIVESMLDPELFGHQFGGESWAPWRALLGAFYALPMDAVAEAAFRSLTGDRTPPAVPADELWVVAGRRGGKSQVAALIGAYEAAFRNHAAKLAPGEVATVLLVAADRKQARTLLRYTRGLFEHRLLRPLVANDTATGLELTNRVTIEIGTASFRGLRGYSVAAAIFDEMAFFLAEGATPDSEVLAAVRPALATLGGKIIAISSPYARRGELWNVYRKHFATDHPRVLVARAPSLVMNPVLPRHVVEDALEEDRARASAEWLAEFRADIEAFLDLEAVSRLCRTEPLVLPPQFHTTYSAFVDPSGGGKDEFTLAIGHRETSGRAVVDLVTGRRGNPASITREFCDLLRQYRVARVLGDRYAAEWSRTEFRRHGIGYWDAPGTRSELYLTSASAINSGRVELPPDELTVKQFAALERRTSRAGRDAIDHPPGQHDDRANAVAGLIAILANDRAHAGPLVSKYGVGTTPSSLSSRYGCST